jgi:3-phenylpropionate/cinnamic acid dioxygenase small subunit
MSDTDLAPLKRMIIERACEQLSVAYARAVDFRDYDAFVELFADDALLDLGMQIKGKQAIRESMQKRSDEIRSRHVLTNISVEVQDSQHARGISYLTLYRHVGTESLRAEIPVPTTLPTAVGHYEDVFVLTPAGWRFKTRTLHVAFRNPSSVKPKPAG